MIISHIVAMDVDGGIGAGGLLPWRFPNELRHFQAMSAGAVIIMGRKTYESLPPSFKLRGRTLIVLSASGGVDKAPHVHPASDPEEALQIAESFRVRGLQHEVLICGGAEIYALFPPDVLYVTRVMGLERGCDTFYPFLESVNSSRPLLLNQCCSEGWFAGFAVVQHNKFTRVELDLFTDRVVHRSRSDR